MSAYVVNKRHIDAIVTAGLREARKDRSPMRWYTPDAGEPFGMKAHQLDETNADEIGVMLWTENVRSVRARYSDSNGDDLPGPNDFTPGDCDVYTFEPLECPLTPVEVLKALDGYEYQTCEHDGWRDPANVARAFCERLQSAAIHNLDGYEDGPWEVPPSRRVIGRFASSRR